MFPVWFLPVPFPRGPGDVGRRRGDAAVCEAGLANTPLAELRGTLAVLRRETQEHKYIHIYHFTSSCTCVASLKQVTNDGKRRAFLHAAVQSAPTQRETSSSYAGYFEISQISAVNSPSYFAHAKSFRVGCLDSGIWLSETKRWQVTSVSTSLYIISASFKDLR